MSSSPRSELLLRITPLFVASPERAWRIVRRNIRVYQRRWYVVVSGFFEPFFYLLSIGVGLNHLVGSIELNGRSVSYTLYVAPGLLASSAMNGAVFDSTYNLFFKLKVTKIYDAVLSTPIGIGDVAIGELGWALTRGAMYSTAFLIVMAGFGLVKSPWALCCLPAALLIGAAFGAIGAAATTFMKSWQSLSTVALAMLPLFLFSGTFFQLSAYPRWFAVIVEITPLYQGVVLLRGFDLGLVSTALIGHAAYLVAMVVIGLFVSSRRLQKILAP
jgi:lipooligosaccharide transport system permease protein